MDTNTYKRYTAEQCLQTQTTGNLYKGHDSVLHRDVMLYITKFDVSVDSGSSVIQAVKNGSQLPEDRFMHVWDIEVDSQSIMIVLKPELGYFLADELESHILKFDEILLLIRQLGQSMQEAAGDGVLGYSVYANNIWIQGHNQPIVINYWNNEDKLWSGASGLARLLYQLVVRTNNLPADIEAMDASLLSALRELPDAKKEAVSRWMRAALQDRKSLSILLQGLDQLLLTHKEKDQHQEIALTEKKYNAPVQKPVSRQTEETLEPNKESGKESRKAAMGESVKSEPETKKKMGKKQKWILIGALLSVLLVTEILVVQLLRKPDSPSIQTDIIETPVSEKPAPTPVVPPPTTPAPTVPKPATDQEQAIVPNLKGIPLADAEKKLLDLGLKYQYFLEANEEFPGSVFKQEPQAEQSVAKGTVVTFYVGK
jgi:hypothetical protein